MFEDDFLPEEKDIIDRLNGQPYNFEAMTVVTNLYRAAQRMRVKMEREVLSAYNLSWTAFDLLHNLWIWEPLEMRKAAKLMGVTVATVSSITNTLERKELCMRLVDQRDRRLVQLKLTDQGREVIEDLYPKFNKGEVEIIEGLTELEQKIITNLLRRIIRNMDDPE
ncbi:MarR family transcriptional regulator [Aneurinibacillus uraniidurans]|uniref:MarR family transcriptional regulator n=1 Tax=Aneurinibacillus uraniidurans TaxID=2966586 RepID=UPI002349196C|nr:MarR family transcriptional regulator [Aneurinibacillus sp. B1]WCN39233.1 MarR family transcriptional regulator [Aneurinibacillus sp. B1]